MKRLSLRRAHSLVLAMLCLAGAATCAAQSASRAASITAGVHETTLPNGLKVITKEVHSAPVVSFSVWYRVGSRNEHTGITGTSHLLEHMMFKGTKKYGPKEFDRVLESAGGRSNA